MGHLLSTKSSLVPLIDRLNRYPIGLVDSAKLREILGLLFDEREAFVASRFPLMEATLEELCKATGLLAPDLDAILESMANKGLVMDLPYGGTTYYLLMPGLIGFMEFTFMRQRGDLPVERLARLMTEYLHEQGRNGQAGEFFGSRTQIARALVYDEPIPVSSRITPYQDARRIIRDSTYRAVTMCYCRHKRAHMGQSCRKGAPVEGICMVLGEGALWSLRLRLRARRHLAGEAARVPRAAARPSRPLRPDTVGEGAAIALHRRGAEAPVALAVVAAQVAGPFLRASVASDRGTHPTRRFVKRDLGRHRRDDRILQQIPELNPILR